MLTADLVDARKKDGELRLRALDDAGRAEALALAEAYLETARAFVGRRREELDEAWDAEEPERPKLAAGLKKLAADACVFEAETAVDPVEIRRVVFTTASEARRGDVAFDRARVLAEASARLGLAADAVERGMFSDLRDEHLLKAAPSLDAKSLVEAWELGQAQAVLLTAVRITCDIVQPSPGLARAFFAKLKFHRLLFSVTRIDDGFRIVIDGPYSMFDSVTKYGVKLACVLPALRELGSFALVAEIRWGKQRDPLVFKLASGEARSGDEPVHLSDEAAELAAAIDGSKSGWRARPASVLLDVPGHGICIPDLELTRKKDRVYVEVLGYWSRDAVFRRVELAERGLGARVVFALSSRLRVSPEVLGDDLPASLYVYKGKMSPRAVIEHAERLVSRP